MPKSQIALRPEDAAARRAPPVLEKLELARAHLADIEQEVGLAALNASENTPGASAKMADLDRQITEGRRAVSLLEKAHLTAVEIDQTSDAQLRIEMRNSQFSEMKKRWAQRLAGAGKMMDGLAIVEEGYREYATATRAAADVKPTGTEFNIIGMGPNNAYGSALGNLETLIAVELYRLSQIDENGQRFIHPMAKPATWSSLGASDQIPTGIEVLKQVSDVILADIEGQLGILNARDLAAASKVNISSEKAA